MSIAFDKATSNDNNTIQRGHHGFSACNRLKGSTDLTAAAAAAPMMMIKVENEREDDDDDDDDDECSDSDNSSIGRNSDLSSVSSVDGDDQDQDQDQDRSEIEVQSVLKSPLDTMDDLRDVLPIRKGLSMHYSGKSKSYTSLADAVSSTSIKEIAKPINPYNKKRKNDLLHGLKNHNQKLPPRVNSDGVIFKRMTNGNCSSGSSHGNLSNLNTESSSPPICLPPRHPQVKVSPINEPSSSFLSPRQNNLSHRSYSHSDLHNFVPGLVIDNRLI